MSIIRQLARVANRIDSASTGTFLSKGDSTGDFTLVDYTDLSGRPTTLDSAALTTIVDSAYIQARQTGGGGAAGLDSAAITALVDSNYVVARSPSASSGFAQYEYTATAGQTTFQDSDINGNVMSYTADGIFVFYNGVLIAPTTDYEATDGSSVVLTTGADSGSHVAISKWSIAGGGGSSAAWNGDRGFAQMEGDGSINYFDVTTPGNASDFGDLIRYSSNTRRQGSMTSNGSTIFHYGGRDYSSGSFARTNAIESFVSATLGNSSSFGSLTVERSNAGGSSDGTYTVVFGGGTDTDGYGATIDYFTMASAGNASDFGDATPTLGVYKGTISDGTYGVFGDGQKWSPNQNKIEYVTIATPSNSTDFGDLTVSQSGGGCHSDTTRGVFMGGNALANNTSLNVIDYVTIATPSNATDFGDLSTARDSNPAGIGNNTYACSVGGYSTQSSGSLSSMEYITIQTTGNASSFGNLTTTTYQTPGASGSPS